ncbi:hypothetical protein [Sanyastnella coralliicola]|uniref:hypothetical protein n=1 Tax=Sanyastnella coralliicola TaxID=3069118 RepID=UPI0027BAEB2E|nr:hypothetical protein [Longitalea sp. SCSIO 12813]
MTYALTLCTLLVGTSVSAQIFQTPLERHMTTAIEWSISGTDTTLHTSMKPFHYDQFTWDSVPRFDVCDRRYFNNAEVKFHRDHLIQIEEDDFQFYMDIVLDLDLGRDFGDTSSWQDTVQIFNNTRGLAFYGQIGDRVGIHATVFENQTQFRNWMFNLTDSLAVIPGQGRFKELESNARDYNSATGVVSVKATDWLQVHFGQGKHFIGNGYRSMLLSDVAFNYPFLRLQGTFWKNRIQFTSVNAELNNLERLPLGEVPESLFKKKGFTFRYLNIIPHPRFEIGLYEGVIWQRWDSTGTKAYPAPFFIPVPFAATGIYGLDSLQNSVVGVNLKAKITDNLYVYGQGVADQEELRFTGFQAGFHWREFPFRNMSLQFEYNEGGQGIFTHRNPLQSYSHMNQGLAHPLGTNFKEYVVILRHGVKRLWSEWKGVYQIHDGGNRGNIAVTPDIVLSSLHEPGTTLLSDLRFGYLMNPTTNLNMILGWSWRSRETETGALNSSYYYMQFRLALFNRYYDI